MKTAWAFLLLGVAAAHGEELTNAPIAGVTPPVSYTRTIQLYRVPVDYRSPAEVERDAKLRAEAMRLRTPGEELEKALTAEPPPPQQPPNPAPHARKRSTEDKAENPGADDKNDQKKESGWGWLADNVRQAETKRSDLALRQREEDEAEQAKKDEVERLHGRGSDGSNAASRAEGEWSSTRNGGRRDYAPEGLGGRLLPSARESRDARAASTELARRESSRSDAAPAAETAAPTWLSPGMRADAAPATRESLLGSLQPAGGVQPAWGAPSPALQSAWGNGLGLRPSESPVASPFQQVGGLLGGWNGGAETPRQAAPASGSGLFQPAATPVAGAELYKPASSLPSAPALGNNPALPGVQTRTLPW